MSPSHPLKVLVLGANGFIGNSLVEHVLSKTDWEITGLDLHTSNLTSYLDNPRFKFKQASMLDEKQWVEDQIKSTDVVLPLVAIATPATYVSDPLRIFELDFEANLAIVRLCVKHKKRIIFPSTSEVYGMCPDKEFDEETSNLVTGPIHKERWIYSCSKQMMDRIIYAYGSRGQLDYTLFRPFNWMGPKLDNVSNPKKGGSRVITQFCGNILRGEDITLVNGGAQKRSFIDIDDGITALLKIIENKNGCASQKIFNIGNPANDVSIRELAELLIKLLKNTQTKLIEASGNEYFGEGYQDVQHRVPSIKRAMNELDWKPVITLEEGLKKILDYHLPNR
jgi:nucleoside-diphosphate-sugar epimerase